MHLGPKNIILCVIDITSSFLLLLVDKSIQLARRLPSSTDSLDYFLMSFRDMGMFGLMKITRKEIEKFPT
jgi:hypothetical protein